MVELSLTKNVDIESGKQCILNYLLLSNGTSFDLECYKDRRDQRSDLNYCYIKDFSRDRNYAESLVRKFASSEVFPVHIRDIIEDMME